jgi:hypothetical protein
MHIVIVHPVVQDTLPTTACFFCGYPVHQLGIRCVDEAAGSAVLGLVCMMCLHREPAQLQATLNEKARLLCRQESTLRSQAEQLLAQAEALERWAREPIQMPPLDDLERISHLLD